MLPLFPFLLRRRKPNDLGLSLVKHDPVDEWIRVALVVLFIVGFIVAAIAQILGAIS